MMKRQEMTGEQMGRRVFRFLAVGMPKEVAGFGAGRSL